MKDQVVQETTQINETANETIEEQIIPKKEKLLESKFVKDYWWIWVSGILFILLFTILLINMDNYKNKKK